MEQDQNISLFGLGIDPASKAHLSEAARWAKFLAICGFIMLGLMIIYGLLMALVFAQFTKLDDSYQSNEIKSTVGVVMFIIYTGCAVLAFFPYLFLLRFSNKMKRALESEDQSELNNSFMNLKILYRYLAILTIIGLGFMVLIILSMIISSAAVLG